MSRIAYVSPVEPVVNDKGVMTNSFQTFTFNLSKLGIAVGTGSPEGVVPAGQAELYLDETGSTGSLLYIKKQASIAGDTTQGWEAI